MRSRRSITSPPEMGSSPAIHIIRVVLPQPEGPTTDTNWPAWTANSMLRTAGTSPLRDR